VGDGKLIKNAFKCITDGYLRLVQPAYRYLAKALYASATEHYKDLVVKREFDAPTRIDS
jgi:hypothetical protein